MNLFSINVSNVSKAFSAKKIIFQNIGFEVKSGEVLGIAGPNGSGKSTLMKIVLGVIRPDSGNVAWSIGDKTISKDEYNQFSGFAAPYLNLYEEFTAVEMIDTISKLRGEIIQKAIINELLRKFLLLEHINKPIRNFSSGMKQRVKLLIASMHNPALLALDEPSSNLDNRGFDIVCQLIEDSKNAGSAIILASNEDKELALCNNIISITNN